MQLLLTIYQQDFQPDAPLVSPDDFYRRRAVRSVVFDLDKRVGLMHARKDGHYKLPGGGIEDGENKAPALERELLEELGCKVNVLRELGEIVEYRDYKRMHQTSYCYLSAVVGEKGKPSFTQKELDNGFEIVWAEDLDSAIKLIEKSPTSPKTLSDELDIRFIQVRDAAFLRSLKSS
jgi:ADP-ribose pyrophosphatase YjhB (NUDIX family)